ncbi:rho-N domain-containing protein 1, chloroplastic isoform X2 [Juglans regia]|uniref:Rho-N domain-containing protein 1, chloroplastic isoform X2 n=1 Tax=Juglans regia TaxID=51240 RepID=A0A6P9EBU2_JUGRE|nr:rho-N domain-containing protein 1, chloroplastic isoform X2 [Juglans regia]
MNAVAALHLHGLQLPIFLSFRGQPRLGGKPIYSLKEIADGPSLFHSQKDFPFLTVSCIRSDGNRRRGPPWRSSASRRINEGENETPQSSSNGKKSNASDQEEIIALFRRIQSSISKGESVSPKKTNSNESKDKPSPDLILEALRKSRKQIKGDADKPSNKEGKKVLTGRRGVPQKEEVVENSPPVAGLKSTRPPSKFVKRSPIPSRPPSKFVKRSPIPSPSTSRGRTLELNNEVSQARAGSNELKFRRIEEMKLTELKELAKSRGIKGYSKLKKSELLELLRS